MVKGHFYLFVFFFQTRKNFLSNKPQTTLEHIPLFIHSASLSDMNKYEQIGAQELLDMLNEEELMSVKDTVTKGMMPVNTVRR